MEKKRRSCSLTSCFLFSGTDLHITLAQDLHVLQDAQHHSTSPETLPNPKMPTNKGPPQGTDRKYTVAVEGRTSLYSHYG